MSQSLQEIVNMQNDVKSSSQRVWEVDFLRGFLLLFVVLDHFMFNVWYFCSNAQTAVFRWLYGLSLDYYNEHVLLGAVQNATHNGFIMAFVFIAGVSCALTSSNLKRALKLSAVALLLTAVTSALSQVVYRPLEINFNVIHVLAVCCFVWCLVEAVKQKLTVSNHKVLHIVLVCIAVVLGVVGYYFHANPIENGGVLVVLIRCGNSSIFSPADYLPLLPALSFYIVGACVGAKAYGKRQSVLGSKPQIATPFCWLGKYSLYVYLASQAAMFAIFYLFTQVLPIF